MGNTQNRSSSYRQDARIRALNRKMNRMRAAYRKRLLIAIVVALILGFVLGWVVTSKLAGGQDKTVAPQVSVESEESYLPVPEPTWADDFEPTEEPSVETPEPAAETPEPVIETPEPAVETPEPAVETAEPVAEVANPVTETAEEATETAEPVAVAVEPTAETVEASAETAEPESEEETPAVEVAEATAEPVAEVAEESTPEPVAVADSTPGSRENPVAFGEGYEFTLQVLPDGSARGNANETDYVEVPVTMKVQREITQEYYQQTYSNEYRLKGTEAGYELAFEVGECEGLNELVLQQLLLVKMENEAGDVQPGFQFTNAEIGGDTDSLAATGATTLLYKRYNDGEVADLEYLTASYLLDGEPVTVYFSLDVPVAPEPTMAPITITLQVGDTSDEVKILQEYLIHQGYLTGTSDGQFGQMTADAVKAAQKDFGMEPTGIADPAFLNELVKH